MLIFGKKCSSVFPKEGTLTKKKPGFTITYAVITICAHTFHKNNTSAFQDNHDDFQDHRNTTILHIKPLITPMNPKPTKPTLLVSS